MLEIPFAFEIGGKSIHPADLENEQDKQQLQTIVNSVIDRVEDMRCEEHKETPRFLLYGDTIDDLSLEVHGCCEKLVEQVNARLNINIE